jgi:hypothetical protein
MSMLPTGTVQGVVLDGATPVAYTWITVTPSIPRASETGTTTDQNGNFTLSNGPSAASC